MSGKIIYESESPKTQSIDAVKALLSWRKMPVSPMPDYVEMPGEVFLVANNKKDAYYVTTARSCSCPSHVYHGGPCKHQRKHFGLKAVVEPVMGDRIKPAGKWAGSHNGPVPVEVA